MNPNNKFFFSLKKKQGPYDLIVIHDFSRII